MTREEIDNSDKYWYSKYDLILALSNQQLDFESRTCENCQDYVNDTCTDSKGHYCIRNTSMEDRYVPKFERKDR